MFLGARTIENEIQKQGLSIPTIKIVKVKRGDK